MSDKRRLLDDTDSGSYKKFDSGHGASSHGGAHGGAHGGGHGGHGDEVALSVVPTSDGLTTAEAEERLRRYGPNAIEEKKESLGAMLFKHYINGPMQYMILLAAILSGAIQHWPDFTVMTILLTVNGTMAFTEARRAGDAVDALKKSLAPKCRVYRDGRLVELEARFLVPGDKIMIKLGDIIPADGQLMDGEPCTIDESALTGESLPVTKHPGGDVLAGAVMKTGEIDALVTKTGVDSFLGKSAALVASVQQVGHFQKVLFSIAMTLVIIALVLIIIIIGVLASKHRSGATDIIQLCVTVLIASIPIAMPVVATGTMAVGSRKLARANAIVSRLAAIEEMAGMDILCSDKTGTLTKNKLTVEQPYMLPGVEENELYLAAALASKREHADAIDTAVMQKILNHNIFSEFETTKFKPFDPVGKRTEAHIRDRSGKFFKVSKGAPQVLYKLDDQVQSEEIQDQVQQWVEALAARGLRPLGVARTDDDGQWQYLGLISLFDPPRDDTRDTIERAQTMGVDVKMVTGDHLLIAKETARKLGMGANFHGQEFFKEIESMPESRIQEIVEAADGFAQVYPEHKYLIVEKLQMKGHVTGMTGDGVNDAPALKKADVGVAVEGATDAARAAADIVLLSPGLSTIITAMLRSRKIFQRLKNYVIYRINATTQILLFVFIATIFLHEMDGPEASLYIPAIILVIITIVNDGTIMSISHDKVFPSDRPETWRMLELIAVAVTIGIIGVIEVLAVYFSAINRQFLFSFNDFPVPFNITTLSSANYDTLCNNFGLSGMEVGVHCVENTRVMKTCIFVALSCGGQFSVYAARTHKFFFSRRPGYALLSMSCVAITINVILGIFWFIPDGSLTPSGPKRTFTIVGWLLLTFVCKDIAKVLVYGAIRYSPLEFDEAREKRKIVRKINMYGTADDDKIAKMKHHH